MTLVSNLAVTVKHIGKITITLKPKKMIRFPLLPVSRDIQFLSIRSRTLGKCSRVLRQSWIKMVDKVASCSKNLVRSILFEASYSNHFVRQSPEGQMAMTIPISCRALAKSKGVEE